jgi:histidine triad (HIT) family protein
VLPEKHVLSFHDVEDFTADEAKRMLDFVARVAREQGLEDYRVVVNAGTDAGQTIFHLHWHILSGHLGGMA